MNVRYFLFLLIGYVLSCTLVYADCQVPQYTNTYQITHQSAALSWSYYGNNSPSYQLQWRISGSAAWTTNSTLTTSSTSLTGLTNNTTYEWRVRLICAVGDTSVYTGIQAFQTKCDLPYELNVSNVTYKSAQLSWYTPVSGAIYEVQWRPVGMTAWTIVDGLTTNFLNLTGLPEDTSFEWKVRTICSATATSDFSIGPLFRTRCLPPSNARVTLTNPEAVELKWDSPIANGLFDLQWRQAGTTTWTLLEGITSSEYVLTGLTNGTSYEWQVRTACSATSKSTFTDIRPFQTSCPAPVNLVTTSVTANSATIQWMSFATELQWRTAGSAAWITVSNTNSPYTLTGLTNNTVYEWRVRTVCSPLVASAYTSTQLLTTQCQTPSGAYSYSDNVGGFQLSWYAPEDGIFEVQWRLTGADSWSSVTGILGTNYNLKGVLPAMTYEWRVRRVCSATDYSSFIAAQPIVTTCSIPNYLRTENATSVKVDLVWNPEETGAHYEVQWRISNTPNWTTISGITENRYTLSDLQVNSSYEWRVRKLCSSTSASAFANSQTFTFTCAQPTAFNTTNINFSSATIIWSGVNNYAPYDVQYRQAGTSDWISIANLSTNQYLLSGLSNNTTYEWRVRSSCSVAGTSDYSAEQTFQTKCGSPIFSIYTGSADYNSAVLYWQVNGNTSLYEIQYREIGSTNWTVIKPEGIETDPYFGETTYNYVGKQYTLYNLTSGKTYEWRIRTLCTPSIYSDFADGPTFTTTCLTPSGLSASQSTIKSLTISWNLPTTYLTHYDLQWRMVGAPNWNTVSGLTSKSYMLTNLTPGSSYEYQIRRQCSSGIVSDYSVPATTTMQCVTPTMISAQPVSASSAQLIWGYSNFGNSFDGSTLSHDLQYRILGEPAWTTITGIVGTTYSLTGITVGVNYEWRVRSICSPNILSDFSATYTFQLNCSVPYINSYYTQAGSTSARLSWNSNPSWITSYLLQWRVVGNTNWESKIVPFNINTYIYSLTGLTNNTNYEWRVASTCVNEYLSDFSPTQSFQTTCGIVQYLTVNSVGPTSAELSWSGDNLLSPLNYILQYRVNGTVVWNTVSGITSSAIQLTGLATNTTYEWRVRADCGPGSAVNFSPSSTFLTQCSSPASTYVSSIGTQSAILNWATNAENSVVNLQWRPAYSTSSWNEVKGLAGNAYALSGLKSGTYYMYRLQRECNASGQALSSNWTTSGFSTIYSGASLFSIDTDSISSQTARLTWVNGPDKINYILQWRVRNGDWQTTGPLLSKGYLLTGLMPYTTYDVRLSYIENGVTYEASSSFTTICPRMSFLSATNITATSARLTWLAASVPSSTVWPVSVQWRIAGTQTWDTVIGVIGNSYTLTGLSDNVTYEWRIQTVCSTDVTNASYPASFQTICQLPTSLATYNVSSESAKLRWSGLGSTYSVRYREVGTTDWTTLTGITSSTYAITNLSNNTVYEYAVATNCGLTTTAYTSPVQFKTECVSPRSLGIYAGTDGVQIAWDKSAPTYQVQWRAVGDLIWNNVLLTNSSYTLTGLTPGTGYEYRIRAECAADGAFFAGTLYTKSCYPYDNQGKSTINIISNAAQLTWSANDLSSYGLRWRIVGTTSWKIVPGNVSTPYTLTGLANNTFYEWQLRTVCEPNYGTSQFFQTRCNSPISLRAEEITTTSARLRWNDSKDGTGYEVQWRVAGTSTWTTISGITSTSCLLSSLMNNTSYEWQVRSQCSNEATFQLTTQFKTVNECPLGMYTVRAGSWDDPTVWSCNRVPTLNDQVKLNHALVIPNAYVAKTLTIRYETGAKLTFGIGASIKMGN